MKDGLVWRRCSRLLAVANNRGCTAFEITDGFGRLTDARTDRLAIRSDTGRKIAFNAVVDHALFDVNTFQPYMVPQTKVITQIRHPMKYLTSSFAFQNLQKAFLTIFCTALSSTTNGASDGAVA